MSEPLNDANEIRKLLDQVAYGRQGIDGVHASERDPFDMTNALVRQVFDVARYAGLSGEDKMTLLAYHALLQLQKMTKMNLDFVMATPAKQFIGVAPGPRT